MFQSASVHLPYLKTVENDGSVSKKDNDATCSMFLLHKRSDKVTTNPNQIHVVPSGSYQPATVKDGDSADLIQESLKKAENLMSTVEREFIEEILGKEEADDLYDNEVLKKYGIETILKDTYLLGVGFSPLATHVDVFAISVIDSNSSNMGNNVKEIMSNIQGNFEGKVFLKPFNKHELNQCLQQNNASPSLKAMFRIIVNDYENIANQLKI